MKPGDKFKNHNGTILIIQHVEGGMVEYTRPGERCFRRCPLDWFVAENYLRVAQ